MSMFLFIIVFIFFVLFPVCLVLFSRRYTGKEKAVGILVSTCFSWAGFIVFFLLMLAREKTV